MGNIFNQDFRDFIITLNNFQVEYILVGGYAVILHGYNRTTGDLDIWVNRTAKNLQKLHSALNSFGIPSDLINQDDFLNNNDIDVFSFGRPPVSIDIMTDVKGLKFEKSYPLSSVYETEGLEIRLVHYKDLIRAKKKAGRYKDLNDIEHLEQE